MAKSVHTDLLSIAIQTNTSALLVGPPGVGKTAILEQLVTEIRDKKYGGKGFPLVVTNAAQAMPEDLGGAQVPNDITKTMDAYSMGAIKELIHHNNGVHFLDEYGSTGPQMRAACLSVFEGRVYGDRRLPNVAVIAAMNPPSIATNGSEMTLPESNRPLWIYWEVTQSDWLDWLRGGKGAVANVTIVPDDWEKHIPKTRAVIAAYLQRNPKSIHVEPTDSNATQPWPSMRSWTQAARLLAAIRATKPVRILKKSKLEDGSDAAVTDDLSVAALAGCVGKTHADMFVSWANAMDIPDPEQLLENSAKAFQLVPTDKHDRLIVSLEALAVAANEKQHPKHSERWKAAWEILNDVVEHFDKVDAIRPAAVLLAKSMPTGASLPKVGSKILALHKTLGISLSK